MKRLAALIALLSALVGAAPAGAEGWRLVFSDDFNGRTLDRTKWATRYAYSNEITYSLGKEIQRYADHDNHRVKGGKLSLVARPVAGLPGRYKFESGMIRSRQTFYYGYYETRVKVPRAKGVFPAFWLNPDRDGDGIFWWPPEIDGLEFVNDGTEKSRLQHHSGGGPSNRPPAFRTKSWLQSDPAFDRKSGFFQLDKPFDEDWHVVGILWKPDSVAVFLDGRRLWTRAFGWLNKKEELAGPANILVNLAIGGGWAGRYGVDPKQYPQAYEIDYVRVCQFTEAASGKRHCEGTRYAPSVEDGRYSSPIGDLPKTVMTRADYALSGDRKLDLKLAFDAVPAPTTDNQVHVTLIDPSGKHVFHQGIDTPVPTTQWKGPVEIAGQVALPDSLAAGPYSLMVGVGRVDEKGQWTNIPILASGYGIRNGYLQYKVGTIRLNKGSCSGGAADCTETK